MERQGPLYTLLDASMDATAKLLDAATAQRRVTALLEDAAKRDRQEKRQARGR
jgi:hypothetical protein